MKMASRVRASWAALGERLPGGRLPDDDAVRSFQDWLRDDVPRVSQVAAEALAAARGVAFFLAARPADLPLTRRALAGLTAALEAEPPLDPRAYVEHLDTLCWSLVLYRGEDDTCRVCQADVGLWTDGREVFEICDLLGCCFDARGRPCAAPPDLGPATRAEVLRRYPQAPLVAR